MLFNVGSSVLNVAGLHQNYFRDYSPAVGRYVQSDPIGLKGGINTYNYAQNAPIALADPDGLQVAQGIRAGAAIGSAVAPGAGTVAGAIVGGLVGVAIYEACKSCPPCTPYAKGTVGYLGPHIDHEHFPIGRPHLNLFVVNQNPNTCKCFWNKNEPAAVSPPPQAGWVNLNSGFPPLTP